MTEELEQESALVKLRRIHNLTQKQIADALGITVQTVSNWEVGRAEPKLTIRQFKALLQVLQCSVDQLPDDLGP
jgi:DNA-binding transcriptional regulator YiaG